MLGAPGSSVMTIGYLITYYPKPSHSFIRREIAAVEAQGLRVVRYSIRPGGEEVDEADVAEKGRTSVLLAAGPLRFALAAVRVAVTRPAAFLRALALALRIGRKSARGALRNLAYLIEACLLQGWCRRDGVQHLHAHFGSNTAAVAMLCHELGGPTFSFTAHGIETFDAPEFLALDEKVGRAAFTVAVCHFGRSQLCRWSDPFHWPRIHVVRCGVDQQFLGRTPVAAPSSSRLVCVARLSPEKGHLPLLAAAARIKEAGRAMDLVLVGDGPLRPVLETLIQKLGLQAHVRLAGWKSGAGVIEEILASRALVLPSFSEGLPVVLMEAMALGRPVIASQITGIPELVEAKTTGWLVPAGSDEALATAMTEALDAPLSELDRMGMEGARRVAAMHDSRTEGARLVDLFRHTVEGRKE
jgi:glycosyltransferase involved in cell wall biosynthesis